MDTRKKTYKVDGGIPPCPPGTGEHGWFEGAQSPSNMVTYPLQGHIRIFATPKQAVVNNFVLGQIIVQIVTQNEPPLAVDFGPTWINMLNGQKKIPEFIPVLTHSAVRRRRPLTYHLAPQIIVIIKTLPLNLGA